MNKVKKNIFGQNTNRTVNSAAALMIFIVRSGPTGGWTVLKKRKVLRGRSK